MSSAPDTATPDTSTGAREATFLFADIAGFTALTEVHGDEEAAALVAEPARSGRNCRRPAARK